MDMYHGVSPRTPPHRLTLHEYKKQCRAEELTPPSTTDGSRTLKRKRGAMNLSIDRPSQPHTQSIGSSSPPLLWSFPITPQPQQEEFDHRQSSVASHGPRRVNPYSFATVFKPDDSQPYNPHPVSRSVEPIRGIEYDNPGPRSYSVPLVPIAVDRVRSLKPHKRLPHPGELRDGHHSLHSLRRVAALSSESFTATDTSSLSLSRFPEPPNSNLVSSRSSPLELECEQNQQQSKSPTILHIRGVSFDLVNPHNSLQLQDIETPRERDSEPPDYFHLGQYPSNASASEAIDMTPPRALAEASDSQVRATPTPPRPIFPTFQSAYNSIRKDRERIPSLIDLPLPPIPLPSREPRAEFENPRSIESVIVPSSPTGIAQIKPTTSFSFKKRFSRAFHRKNKSSEQTVRPGSTQSPVVETRNTQPDSIHLFVASENNLEDREVGFGNALQRNAQSEGNMGFQYRDLVPLYDSSPFLRDSASTDEVRRRQVPLLSIDHSALAHERRENLLKFYPTYDFETPLRSKSSTALDTLSMAHYTLPVTTQENQQPDSTIGSILEQYRHLHEVPGSSHVKAQSLDSVQTVALMDSMRMLETTTSGLNQFEFGFARSGNRQDNVAESSHARDISNVRQATARALWKPPGAGPVRSLPPDPSLNLVPPRPSFLERSFSNYSAESLSWISSYGDTRHLLSASQQLDSPIEFGRATSETNLSQRTCESPTPSSIALPQPEALESESQVVMDSNAENFGSPSVQDTAAMTRKSNVDLQVAHDLKHLSTVSAMSGISNISGSIFVINNTGMPAEEDARMRDSGDTSIFLNTSNGHGNSDESLDSRLTPTRSDFPPFPAFQPEAIKPGLWRLSKAERQNLTSDIVSQQQARQEQINPSAGTDPTVSGDDGGTDHDWETIAESRHGTSSYQTEGRSIADWNSRNSINTLGSVSVHPGDSRYHHVYRFRSQRDSNGPVLMPSYNFKGGAGFPNRNALSSPEPTLYTTYKHPTPLPAHPHPFSNSPPQIGSGSPPDRPVITTFGIGPPIQAPRPGLPSFFWSGANLSVVHETATEGSSRCAQHHISDKHSSRAVGSMNSSHSMKSFSSAWLSTNPGQSSSLEVEYSNPFGTSEEHLQDQTFLSSNIFNAGLVHTLREGDPRMASSPLDPDNSFAKLSRLGPEANITGTPNGTGMRWVGSSLVGSSSPFVHHSSSQRGPRHTTPPTPPSSPPYAFKSIPLAGDPQSPLAQYDRKRYGTRTKPGTTNHARRESLYNSSRGEHYVRPYVAHQSKLLELRLAPPPVHPPATSSNSWTNGPFSGHYSRKGIGNQLRQPLLPLVERDPLTVLRQNPRPRSLRITRVPSSVASSTRSRKQFLSWMCLLIVILFPPLTLLYGLSKLDVAMFSYTKGEIEHFGKRQKKVALFGIPLSLGIWTLIVLLAAIH